MRKHAMVVHKALVLLLVAVAGVFMNGTSRVICHEADGRIAIESAHVPGMCQGAAETSGHEASVDHEHPGCSDTPLADDGLQSSRRGRNLAADSHAKLPAAILAFRLPPMNVTVSTRDLHISIPPKPSIVRTTILLV